MPVFSMTGKVRVTVHPAPQRNPGCPTCEVRPLAYGIKPRSVAIRSPFELDRPRYLFCSSTTRPAIATRVDAVCRAAGENPPNSGDSNVVNIMDYKVDSTGKTVETAKINQAINDVAAAGGGVLFFPAGGIYQTGTLLMRATSKRTWTRAPWIRGTGKMRITRRRLRLPGRLPGGGPSSSGGL